MAAPISPSYSCGNFCTLSGDYWYVWMELGFNKWLVYTHVGPLQEVLTKKNKNIKWKFQNLSALSSDNFKNKFRTAVRLNFVYIYLKKTLF